MSLNRPNRSHAVHPRYWELEDDQLANEVCAIADGLEADQKPRVERYLQFVSLYEAKPLSGLNGAAYDTSNKYYEDVYVPLCRSLCDTVQADIAGRQRPKPVFLTTGADWKTRRRAKKLDRFVTACLHLPQDSYTNAWELTADVFLDAAICGVGVLKVYVDGDGHVCLERVEPGRLKVDPREAASGKPCNFFDSYLVDEDKLIATYVDDPDLDMTDEEREKLRGAIMSAATADDTVTSDNYGTTRVARSVKVRHAYRMPISDKKPGKEAICIQGAVLYEREWTRKTSPFVIFRWARERFGFWGTGLIEETKSIAAEFNRAFERMQARMVLSSGTRTYVKQDSVRKEDMEENEDEVIVPYTGDQPPITVKGEPVSPQDITYLQMVRQMAHESPGVSMMSATSRKEQDVTAGVAIRTLIDLATKRFAVKARFGYEYPFVDLGKAIVAACEEWTEETGQDIIVPLPDRHAAREIKWSEAELDIEKAVVDVQPMSASVDDIHSRLQTIQELFSSGLIPRNSFIGQLQRPDLELLLSQELSEQEYVEGLIERYLDAETFEEAEYEPPDGWGIAKLDTLAFVAKRYFAAKRDGAPRLNLDLIRRYMLQLTEIINRGKQPDPGAAMGPMAAPGNPAAPPAPPGPPALGPVPQAAA